MFKRLLALALVAIAPLLLAASEFQPARDVTYEIVINDTGKCSAVAINPRLLLTAGHCGDVGSKVKVYDNGRLIGTGEFVKDSDSPDLALVKTDGHLPGPYAQVEEISPDLDEKVVVVGYPLNHPETVTEGRFAGYVLHNDLMMALTVPVTFGNSGGGAFVVRGGEYKLVGIASYLAATPFGGVWHLSYFVTNADIRAFLK